MRVLVVDAIAPEGVQYLKERGFEVDAVTSRVPKAELHGRLGDYDAIVTRSSTAVTSEFLARARRRRPSPTSAETGVSSRCGLAATMSRKCHEFASELRQRYDAASIRAATPASGMGNSLSHYRGRTAVRSALNR